LDFCGQFRTGTWVKNKSGKIEERTTYAGPLRIWRHRTCLQPLLGMFKADGLLFPPKLSVSVSGWREFLKTGLLHRDIVCRGCEESYGIPHMHEGIISRAQAMGLPKNKRILIYNELNCILLCPACNWGLNGKSAPDRAKVWKEQKEIYGQVLCEWYEFMDSVFKSRLPRYDGDK